MTWRGERRKQLPPDWTQRRAARLKLDGYQCTTIIVADTDPEYPDVHTNYGPPRRCPNRATDVHHAVDGNDHRIESLRSLCADHHKAETQREAQQARGVGPLRLRPKKKHPGLR